MKNIVDDGAEDKDWQVAAHIFEQMLERAADAYQKFFSDVKMR
jgi:hypothetical protein